MVERRKPRLAGCALTADRVTANHAPLPPSTSQFCNIGNPQDLSQPPLTFFRQVLALVNWPAMAEPEHEAKLAGLFPKGSMS